MLELGNKLAKQPVEVDQEIHIFHADFFFDSREIVFYEFRPSSYTINREYYYIFGVCEIKFFIKDLNHDEITYGFHTNIMLLQYHYYARISDKIFDKFKHSELHADKI